MITVEAKSDWEATKVQNLMRYSAIEQLFRTI